MKYFSINIFLVKNLMLTLQRYMFDDFDKCIDLYNHTATVKIMKVFLVELLFVKPFFPYSSWKP